jgi:hypothetical protein
MSQACGGVGRGETLNHNFVGKMFLFFHPGRYAGDAIAKSPANVKKRWSGGVCGRRTLPRDEAENCKLAANYPIGHGWRRGFRRPASQQFPAISNGETLFATTPSRRTFTAMSGKWEAEDKVLLWTSKHCLRLYESVPQFVLFFYFCACVYISTF